MFKASSARNMAINYNEQKDEQRKNDMKMWADNTLSKAIKDASNAGETSCRISVPEYVDSGLLKTYVEEYGYSIDYVQGSDYVVDWAHPSK